MKLVRVVDSVEGGQVLAVLEPQTAAKIYNLNENDMRYLEDGDIVYVKVGNSNVERKLSLIEVKN